MNPKFVLGKVNGLIFKCWPSFPPQLYPKQPRNVRLIPFLLFVLFQLRFLFEVNGQKFSGEE